ncbi:MAG: DUF502 domain-containing protein [Gammaproteobacteria bacterium]
MDKLKNFLKTSLLGGVVVILPMAILVSVTLWIFSLVTGLIQPLTRILISDSQLNVIAAEVIVIILILMACFFVGVLVRTRLGGYLFSYIETRILKQAPGYSMIKDTVLQIFGSNKDSPFTSVALVQVFGNDTLMTAFVTDKHDDGSFTVFVPTGPNPTSGLIYHLHGRNVHPVEISVQDAMRSIISCGAGSAKLMQGFAAGKPSLE